MWHFVFLVVWNISKNNQYRKSEVEIVDLTLIGHLFETSVKLWVCLTPHRHLDGSLVTVVKTRQQVLHIVIFLELCIILLWYCAFIIF